MRRFATIALSLSLVLGLTATHHLFAQDPEKKDASTPEEKKADVPKEDVKTDDAPKEETKKDDAPKEETKTPEPPKEETKTPEPPKEETKKPEPPKEETKKPEPPKEETKKPEPPKEETKKPETSAATEPAPIPPEVEAKLEAARRAVAEAIVAAQDAGLVQTSIDPPPILDILVTGRANDETTIKDRNGVSVEVFGAWWTNFGKPTEGITAAKDVRITQPSKGLQTFFDQRAAMLNKHIKAVRDAKGGDKPKEEDVKKDAPKPAEEPAKAEETKKDEPK